MVEREYIRNPATGRPAPFSRKRYSTKVQDFSTCMSFIDKLLDLQYDISEEELGRGKYKIRNRSDGRGGSALDPKPGTINLSDSLYNEIDIFKQRVNWKKHTPPDAYFDDS